MSDTTPKLASFEFITDIQPHPNADKLDLAKVLGYTCIVGRGDFKPGDVCILIQPDTILPEKPWSEMFRKRSSRVRAMKLRNVWSFGIALSPYIFDTPGDSSFLKYWLMPVNIGKDCSKDIGVTKYEAPVPQDMNAKGIIPSFLRKTDEERYQNFTELPWGEEVDITLKVDGMSFTSYCRLKRFETPDLPVEIVAPQDVGVCTRGMDLKLDGNNAHLRMEKQHDIIAKLSRYCVANKVSLALQGEVFGKSIQSNSRNPHSKVATGFAAFGIFNIDERRMEHKGSKHYYVNVCKELDIPVVDQIATAKLTPELIKYYAEDITELNGVPFEGVVVKHSSGSFKIMNLSYDEHK